MKKFTKILALVLAAVLLVAGTFAATVAWLTAQVDEKKNVFTVGDISISLEEETDVIGEGGTVAETEDGAEYVGVMPGDHLVKEVTVTNTGDVPVYVAVTVTINNALQINKAIDEYYEGEYTDDQIQAVYDLVFEGWGLRYDKYDDENNALGMRVSNQLPTNTTLLHVDSVKTVDVDNDYFFFAYDNWFQSEKEKEAVAAGSYGTYLAKDGFHTVANEKLGIPAMTDYQFRYVYFVKLENKGDAFVPFTGLNAPAFFDNEQMKMFQGLEITVDAAAIQADNFETAKEAFEALYGITTPVIPDAVVSTADDLVAALNEGGQYVLLADSVKVTAAQTNAYGKTALNQKNGGTFDGGGNVLEVEDANGTWDSAINTTGGTIKDLTIDSGFRGIFVNHSRTHSEPVVLEKVIIDGPVYTISCDQGTNQGLTATSCVINGWTSYAATLGEATFIDCDFGEGSGYAFCRPYAPTTFVDCDFEAGYEMDPRAAVTFENCTLGGEPLTADNLATLVTSNIANATVK